MRLSRFLGSIRFRMVAIYFLVIILAFVAVSLIVSRLVESFLVLQRTQEQRDDVARLALEVGPVLQSGDAQALFALLNERAQALGGRVLVLDDNAVVQADTASQYNGYRLPYQEVRRILVQGEETAYGFHKLYSAGAVSPNWVVYYTAPVTVDGRLQGTVLMSSSIQDLVDSVAEVTQQIAIVFLVFIVGICLVSFAVASWITRPIVALTNAIRRVSGQGYSERVRIRGKGEIAELSEAFNVMSEQLERHDRLRNEFVSNASHELKTPLSTIKILTETILYQDTFDPTLTTEFLQDINHEVDRLANIVNDLLRLVQEERQEADLLLSKVHLNELIQRVTQRLTPLARQKDLQLENKLVPLVIDADERRMEQVISNLVDNAIKYTDKGKITVTLRQEGAQAVMSVRDTGIGIPKEALPRLFERFYRVDKARSRGTGGTGLGLSIVERIVALHGGYIHVDSEVGHGTTFTVHLPVSHVEHAKEDRG